MLYKIQPLNVGVPPNVLYIWVRYILVKIRSNVRHNLPLFRFYLFALINFFGKKEDDAINTPRFLSPTPQDFYNVGGRSM